MNLKILDDIFTVIKMPPMDAIPSWALNANIFSIMRTDEELSIVCPSNSLPDNDYFKNIEPDWQCIKIEGVLDFGLTGILASLANPLAENKISIFALSTFNTDYILVKSNSLEKAKIILEKEGHSFNDM